MYPSHAVSGPVASILTRCGFYWSPKAGSEMLKSVPFLKSPASILLSGFPGLLAPEESPPGYSGFKKGN